VPKPTKLNRTCSSQAFLCLADFGGAQHKQSLFSPLPILGPGLKTYVALAAAT
jgi:hypothetical protein